jgi:uncharacterized membrane protein
MKFYNILLEWFKTPGFISFIKSVTYKIISGTTTFFIVYALTGKAKESGHATLIMMFVHFCQYWLHEYLWVLWERKKFWKKG